MSISGPQFRKDIEVLEAVREGQKSWEGVWSTSLTQSGWGSWGCSTCKTRLRGDFEGIARWESMSSPKKQVTVQEEVA